MNPPERISLRRTGRAPLVFRGRPVVRLSRRWPATGVERAHWHEASLYAVAAGGWVVKIAWISTHGAERGGHEVAELVPDLAAARALVQHYDAAEYVIGYPPGARFQDRQRALVAAAAAGWRELRDSFLAAWPAE